MSEARKGRAPWNKGKHHSEETKRKISEALKGENSPSYGKHPTEETRKKLSEAGKGEKNSFYGKHHTAETRKKLSEAAMGNRHSYGNRFTEETRKKMSEAHKHPTEEIRRKLSEALKGEKNPNYGKHRTEETREKIRRAHIEAIKRGCYSVKPTTPEKRFTKICEKHDLPYKYVGDGKFWIEGVNPDFVESNGRKIAIEIYGDYWHRLPNIVARDAQRTATLRKYGWKLLVLWEHELNKLPEGGIVRRVRAHGQT